MKLKATLKKAFALLTLALTVTSCSKQLEFQEPDLGSNSINKLKINVDSIELVAKRLSLSNNLNRAENYVFLATMGIDDKNLDIPSNKVIINPNGTTVFKAYIKVVDMNQYYPKVKMYVIHVSSQNIETVISRTIEYAAKIADLPIAVECILPAGLTDGTIRLRFDLDGVARYSPDKFGLIDNGSGDHTANYYVDGKFYHNTGDGKVYVCMEGKYRYIQSTNTLYGVFKTNPELNPVSSAIFNAYFTSKVGEPVGPSARIVMDNYTSKIYYQENGILRYITSRAAAERWSLDIEKRQYMNGTGGLSFGPNI